MPRRIPTATQGYIAPVDRPGSNVPTRGSPRFGHDMGEQRWGRAEFDRAFAGLPGGEQEGALGDADYEDEGAGTFRYGPPRTTGPYAAGGPKGYTRSDEAIREDVCERLAKEEWLDLSEVEIDVSGGEVILRGSVASRRQKHAIEDVAAEVAGVIDVTNELRVH